jgi:hypothetical protein
MKWLPPSQRGLSAITEKERAGAYELTKLYRVERAARRLVAAGDRCRWAACADLGAALLALRGELEQVDGWGARFFHLEDGNDE